MAKLVIKRRREEEAWKKLGDRRLVYGRRKTGKSFFVRNFTEWDAYFVVGSDGTVYEDGKEVSYDILKDRIRRGEYVVVDEFHRLPREFLYFLQAVNPEKITLVTSTLHLVSEIMSKGSPILGMFGMLKFGLVSPIDALQSLRSHWEGKELLERAVYYADPFVLQFNPKQPLRSVLKTAMDVVPLITSEIFTEEEKELTRKYQRALRAVPGKAAKFVDIKARLGNEGAYYVNVLTELGILERIPVWKNRRFLYRHVSPVFDLYYYLDAKYSVSETGDVPEEALLSLVPFHVEVFAERFFAEMYKLRPVKILNPEIDFALVRFKRLALVGEVKWKGRVTKEELREIERKFRIVEEKYGKVKKVLVVPDTSAIPETEMDVWDVERMVVAAQAFYG